MSALQLPLDAHTNPAIITDRASSLAAAELLSRLKLAGVVVVNPNEEIRLTADFLFESAAKGGIAVLALYGSAFLRHIQVERWRRDRA